jgi:hypothetical protein
MEGNGVEKRKNGGMERWIDGCMDGRWDGWRDEWLARRVEG